MFGGVKFVNVTAHLPKLYSRGAQSLARGPNVAREVIKNGPRGHSHTWEHALITRVN